LIDVKRCFHAYTQYHLRILEIVSERPARSLVLNAQEAFADPAALWAKLKHFLEIEGGPGRFTVPVFSPSEFTRLAITRELSAIFKTLLPDAAAAFDSLNDRSAFRAIQDPCPAELQPVFLHLSASIRAAGARVASETWLPVLIDLCAPRESESYFSLQGKILARASARVEELSGWIAQLEEARDWNAQQAVNWQAEAERLARLLSAANKT